MKGRIYLHPFWGSHSPLSSLSGLALIILCSTRFSFALFTSGALVWVYGLTALAFSFTRRFMPARGRMIILLFLSTFICGLFALLSGLLSPLLLMGAGFFLVLIPPCCLGSGFFEAADSLNSIDVIEIVSRALIEAGVLAGIIMAFSLIREPLGMGTLSIPGSVEGINELFYSNEVDGFFTIRILCTSAGGLLLLGYAIALYRYLRRHIGGMEEIK